MCYYSTSLRKNRVRDAKANEDLVLVADSSGHHLPTASDGKIVCMAHGSEVHIAKLAFNGMTPYSVSREFTHLVGQPVSGRFVDRLITGYAADRIVIGDYEVHFLYLAPGTKFYIGQKRLDVADKLGVNDRSITLDHMPPDPKPEDQEQTPAPAEQPAPEPTPETTPAPETVTA